MCINQPIYIIVVVVVALLLSPCARRGGLPHLPKRFRGRCQPRKIVNVPVYSATKTARCGEYNPLFEVSTMRTKRRVKQMRRLQSLYRRMGKHDSLQTDHPKHQQMVEEWTAILRCTSFGMPFCRWV